MWTYSMVYQVGGGGVVMAPQGISRQWEEWRGFRWSQDSEMKKRVLMNHWKDWDLLVLSRPSAGGSIHKRRRSRQRRRIWKVLSCVIWWIWWKVAIAEMKRLIFLSMQMYKIKLTNHLYWKLNVQCLAKSVFTTKSRCVLHTRLQLMEIVLM